MTNKLLTVGIIGTVTAGLCCLTPFLPWVLSGIGLSGVLGYVYRDDVLLPLMAFFIVMTGYALWRHKRTK